MKFFLYILFFISISLNFSCKKNKINKTITITSILKDKDNLKDSLTNIPQQNMSLEALSFKYFDAKAKLDFEDGENDFKARADIRMRKDSIIWIRISVLAFEGVRLKATKDSVHIIDYQKKEYLQFDYKTLSEMLLFDINYTLLQSVVLGEMPMPMLRINSIVVVDNQDIIRQISPKINVDNYVNKTHKRIEKVVAKENNTANALELSYTKFESDNSLNKPFANTILALLSYKGAKKDHNTKIDIDYKKYKFIDTALEFPFKVPESYKRK